MDDDPLDEQDEDERPRSVVPGNALVVDPKLPFRPKNKMQKSLSAQKKMPKIPFRPKNMQQIPFQAKKKMQKIPFRPKKDAKKFLTGQKRCKRLPHEGKYKIVNAKRFLSG